MTPVWHNLLSPRLRDACQFLALVPVSITICIGLFGGGEGEGGGDNWGAWLLSLATGGRAPRRLSLCLCGVCGVRALGGREGVGGVGTDGRGWCEKGGGLMCVWGEGIKHLQSGSMSLGEDLALI